MKITRQRLMEIIKEEYDAMLVSEDKSQSEAAISSIEAAVFSTISTLFKDIVPESKIQSLTDSSIEAIKSRISDDLRQIYEEPAPTEISEIVMTQEPMDILYELRALANQLSSVSGNSQPFQEIAMNMASQINDLEEILTTEEK